ncbi:MAG: FtsW/RodA/SpoVE family cell cycle protein [Roseburia sp.]|nr:FtsW/RodA/SpoVE family cell cycle protein [Roseburia sp.]
MINIKEKAQQWLASKRYNWKNYDIVLIVVVLILSLISSYMLSILGVGSLKRQVVAVVAGLFIVIVFSLLDYHTICMYVPVLYVAATILVAATRFSPLGSKGVTDSYRWLDFRVFMFQPSEVCKIIVILTLATFLMRRRDRLQSFKTFFLACLLAVVPTMFILVQSDLSSSVVIMVVLVIMLISSGMGRKIFGPVVAVLVPVSAFLIWYIQQPFQILLKDYQLQRINGFLNPESEALGIMYQQNNSVLSIASGKLYGKRLLEGASESRNYHSVDVTESDFIWTPISEEFGFIGCMVILTLLSIIIIKCFIAAKRAKDYMGMMIAIGIGSMFCFQTFFNIGVATSILPNTGLPLPFLSNGLSSLVSNMMAVGILINISIQPNRGSNGSFADSLSLNDRY